VRETRLIAYRREKRDSLIVINGPRLKGNKLWTEMYLLLDRLDCFRTNVLILDLRGIPPATQRLDQVDR
jgi:hypothetical protein